MAILDTTNNEVVIRIVYDGPPEAGKTTSVRALATSFNQESHTPEENETGRTQWFDWMEYVGGRFEGSQIRCQVVSVPGQRELGARREALLASADVIVFVGDTTRARWDVSLEYLLALQRLRDQSTPVGIVFQANKRDVSGALSLAEIRTNLGEARWEVSLIESVASDGTGIREAFVYAVRLALDRVRELVTSGQLREGRPGEMSPAELLAQLRAKDITTELAPVPPPVIAAAPTIQESLDALEAAWTEPDTSVVEPPPPPRIETSPTSVAATLLNEVIANEAPKPLPPIPPAPRPKLALASAPRPPDASVPSGAIWPPVEGRAILVEVSQIELVPRRHANGDWSAGLGSGWRLVSKRDALFDSLDQGRNALVQWARLHAACSSVVSPHRCIVLAATGDGNWRLWQIVRAEESLRDVVERASCEPEAEQIVDSLCQTAQLLVEVHERLAGAPCELLCSLDTVGACDASGMYIGLMPESPVEPAKPRVPSDILLENELGPMLALDLAEKRSDLGRVLSARNAVPESIVSSLQRLLE